MQFKNSTMTATHLYVYEMVAIIEFYFPSSIEVAVNMILLLNNIQ